VQFARSQVRLHRPGHPSRAGDDEVRLNPDLPRPHQLPHLVLDATRATNPDHQPSPAVHRPLLSITLLPTTREQDRPRNAADQDQIRYRIVYCAFTMWPGLEWREIRTFLTVAEELHFGRAAERLGITPSYVSQTIRALEGRVGGKLFERTSRRVRLTPVGEQLQASLAPAYEQVESALADARDAAVGVAGRLRIGIYFTLSGGPHMAEIVHTFETRQPDCEVEFVNTGYERNYLDVLRAREVDLLATRIPLTAPDISVGPILSREERVVVVARDDPLAQRESVSYEDLADRVVGDVPSFPREMMDAFIPPATPSGRVLKRIPNIDPEVVMMRVALGEQVHPTVRSFLEHETKPGITSVPIHDLPPSETALVWLTSNLSPKVQAFVEAAADVLARTELAAQPGASQHQSNSGLEPV
jgi:DNA-binding transcriptional LysR family regulator